MREIYAVDRAIVWHPLSLWSAAGGEAIEYLRAKNRVLRARLERIFKPAVCRRGE